MKVALKKLWFIAVLLIFCTSAVPCQAAGSQGIHVNYHSQKEIRNYLKSKKININKRTTYSQDPKLTKPYSLGKVSSGSLKSALNTLNAVRYIAGIDDNVKLDSSYTKQTQAAALTNYANRILSHSPKKPKGMSQSLYNLGRNGAGSSNIAMASWDTSLGFSIVKQWMEDGDASNVSRVGHRRWILNPSMKKTGFGWVNGANGTYSAMYAFDDAFGETPYYGVSWPAQNMPLSYFGNDYPWSISMGTQVDASRVKVTLTRIKDGKKWEFSAGSQKYGYFNVENSNYGKSGCIIFRPNRISYKSGDKFQVKITGLKETVTYQVQFFSL